MPWWNAIAGPNTHMKKPTEPYPWWDAVVGTQSAPSNLTKKQTSSNTVKVPNRKPNENVDQYLSNLVKRRRKTLKTKRSN